MLVTPASAQCVSFMQRTHVLFATLQCVFTPVVHVVSSMHATQVLVVGRHAG
jgi:hypothetical protein